MQISNHSRYGGMCRSAAAILYVSVLSLVASEASAQQAPLVFEKSIVIADVPVGPYSDYLSVDLPGGRLFATPQAAKAVAVLDMRAGVVLKMIPIGNPHGTFLSPSLKRLFIVDGASGDLKVFNSEDYALIKTIHLTVGADGLAYDPRTHLIYVSNGGHDGGMDHAVLSVMDPIRMEKLVDIPVDSAGIEGVALDSDRQLAYVNLDESDRAVAVVDLKRRQTIATLKFSGEHRAKGLALDSANNRLYVACRDSAMRGSIIVMNAGDGTTIATLPIGGWADGIFLDKSRRRIYVSTGVGYIDTYALEPNNAYRRLPSVETAILAKSSLFSSDLDRLFVDVPHLGSGDKDKAQVMIFRPAP